MVEPILVNVKINGFHTLVSMKLNSGAGISTLPKNLGLNKIKNCSIEPTKVTLKIYNDSVIEPQMSKCIIYYGPVLRSIFVH